MTTKDWAIIFCSAIALVPINHRANAKPMDSVAAEKLPELKAIVQTVRSGSGLSPADIEKLRESLRSGDPVLISIASWCALRLGSQGDLLQPELSQLTERIGDMPYAFVTLAKEEKSGRQLSAVKRKERLEKLVASENPYLKVEAAKQLLRIDKSAGRKLLAKLAEAPANAQAATEASRELRKLERSEGKNTGEPLPYTDERYETVLSIIE